MGFQLSKYCTTIQASPKYMSLLPVGKSSKCVLSVCDNFYKARDLFYRKGT